MNTSTSIPSQNSGDHTPANNGSCRSVMIFSPFFPPTSGGVSLAGYELARAFQARGGNVCVIAAKLDNTPETLTDIDFALLRLTPPRTLEEKSQTKERFQDAWKSHDPQVLILNGWGPVAAHGMTHHMTEAIIEVATENETPIIFRSHGFQTSMRFRLQSPPFFGLRQFHTAFKDITAWIKRCQRFSQIVFLSAQEGIFKNYDRRLASRLKLPNVSDIPNTFESIRLDHNSFRERHCIQGTLFVCIASFSLLKNQMGIIRSVRKSDVSGATFVFVGPEKNTYAVESENLAAKDPRFLFLYGLPREDVIEAQNACDCALLFSTHEQQPLVLLEAMSCGKPWICTDVGSVGEMRGGIVLGRRRSKDLIQAIKTMQDPETRVRFGREGYEQWVDKFSPESVYARWDKLLEDVAARKPVRGGY